MPSMPRRTTRRARHADHLDQDGAYLRRLTGTRTGQANAASIDPTSTRWTPTATTGDNAGLSQLFAMAPKDLVKDVAKDAIVKVSGFEIHSAVITLNDAIDGVALVLKKENLAGRDRHAGESAATTRPSRAKAQTLVSQLNNLAKQPKLAGRLLTPTPRPAALLAGDPLLLAALNPASAASSANRSAASPATTASLASLGITTRCRWAARAGRCQVPEWRHGSRSAVGEQGIRFRPVASQ